MKRPLLAFVLACALCLVPSAVQALPMLTACEDHATVIEKLRKGYNETLAGIGVTDGGSVVEFLMAPDGRTWTILITPPNAKTCLLGAGNFWETVKPVKGEQS